MRATIRTGKPDDILVAYSLELGSDRVTNDEERRELFTYGGNGLGDSYCAGPA